jgi:hypothetical protein
MLDIWIHGIARSGGAVSLLRRNDPVVEIAPQPKPASKLTARLQNCLARGLYRLADKLCTGSPTSAVAQLFVHPPLNRKASRTMRGCGRSAQTVT